MKKIECSNINCNSGVNIQKHHITYQKDDSIIVYLCNKCHKEFHRYNLKQETKMRNNFELILKLKKVSPLVRNAILEQDLSYKDIKKILNKKEV